MLLCKSKFYQKNIDFIIFDIYICNINNAYNNLKVKIDMYYYIKNASLKFASND